MIDILTPCFITIGCFAAILIPVAILLRMYQRSLVPTTIEWLPLLSKDEWRSLEFLRTWMEFRTEARFGGLEVARYDLEDLVFDGLAEMRIAREYFVILHYEYRLTEKGRVHMRHFPIEELPPKPRQPNKPVWNQLPSHRALFIKLTEYSD